MHRVRRWCTDGGLPDAHCSGGIERAALLGSVHGCAGAGLSACDELECRCFVTHRLEGTLAMPFLSPGSVMKMCASELLNFQHVLTWCEGFARLVIV